MEVGVQKSRMSSQCSGAISVGFSCLCRLMLFVLFFPDLLCSELFEFVLCNDMLKQGKVCVCA